MRGSSPSDNRYLVDGAPAGCVFHAFSTSIFNEHIIQDFELYSAGFGPRYGNAIGGVFDIKLRDPNQQEFTTKLDASFLRGGVFFEGTVAENSAFYLSARASVLQYIIDEKDLEEEDGIRFQSLPEDTDYQFKYIHRFSERENAVFKPFYRLKTTHVTGGHGMGLAMIERLAQWHNGTMAQCANLFGLLRGSGGIKNQRRVCCL